MAEMVTLEHKELKNGKEPAKVTVPASAAKVLGKSGWKISKKSDQPEGS